LELVSAVQPARQKLDFPERQAVCLAEQKDLQSACSAQQSELHAAKVIPERNFSVHSVRCLGIFETRPFDPASPAEAPFDPAPLAEGSAESHDLNSLPAFAIAQD